MKKILVIVMTLLTLTIEISFASNWRKIDRKEAAKYEKANYKSPKNSSLNGEIRLDTKEEYKTYGFLKLYESADWFYPFKYVNNYEETELYSNATGARMYYENIMVPGEIVLTKGKYCGLYVNDKTKEIVYIIHFTKLDDVSVKTVGQWFWDFWDTDWGKDWEDHKLKAPDVIPNPFIESGEFSYKKYNASKVNGVVDIKLLRKNLGK